VPARSLFPLVILASLSLCPALAWAQTERPTSDHAPDPAERRAARILADEGLSLFQKGDYQAALGKFEQAEKLVPAPTIALERARCLEKLGRYLEARERYEAIVAEELPATAPFVMHKAQDDAGREVEALKPRIPSLSLTLDGPRDDTLQLYVDDKPETVAAFEGVDRAIDPGAHTVELRRSDTSVSRAVKVAEGEHARVRIVLPPMGTAKLSREEAQSRSELMRGLAYLSFGLGGASLLAGTVTGISAASARSDLKAECPKSACRPGMWDEVDRYDALRAATTATLILGVAGIATGTTLVIVAPRSEKQSVAIRSSLGPGRATIAVDF
jgi:tetratricopeptide (TPR) repeat protein